MVSRDLGERKMGDVGQKVWSFSYAGWTSSNDLMDSCTVGWLVNITVYLKFAKRLYLSWSHHKKKKQNMVFMWGGGYIN